MKKYLAITLVTLMLTGILFSCKKSNTSTPKDYTASIKDKTWWGQLTYTGQTAEYYSVHFNADGSLQWSQLSGDYTGHWVVNDKQLIMTFDANSVRIEAEIGDDNKLGNITATTNYYVVNSGELVANPNLPLDNTSWKGTYFNGSSQQPLQFSFSPGLKISITFGSFPTQVNTYTRSSSGAVIRYGVGGMYPFFGVVASGNLMKGSEQDFRFPWQAIKQ
jgi:hypothetical protein